MYKVKKSKMPHGWVGIDWEDSNGKLYKSQVPEGLVEPQKEAIFKHGGIVKKIIR